MTELEKLMSNKAKAMIRQLTDCLNRHDAEGAAAFFAEQVKFWQPSYDEPRNGRAAVQREFAGLLAMLPDIQFTPLILLVDGDRLVLEWQYQATYLGRPLDLRECALMRLNGRRQITEIRIYFDRLTLLRQLGLFQEA